MVYRIKRTPSSIVVILVSARETGTYSTSAKDRVYYTLSSAIVLKRT